MNNVVLRRATRVPFVVEADSSGRVLSADTELAPTARVRQFFPKFFECGVPAESEASEETPYCKKWVP